MRDYAELVKALRYCSEHDDCGSRCPYFSSTSVCADERAKEAADAIEELLAAVPKWISVRDVSDEEREYWSTQLGYDIPEEEAVIFCSALPDDGQEVLVCSKWGHVWIDEFRNDPDYGVGLETNGDMDGILAWMPLPKPMEVSDDA